MHGRPSLLNCEVGAFYYYGVQPHSNLYHPNPSKWIRHGFRGGHYMPALTNKLKPIPYPKSK